MSKMKPDRKPPLAKSPIRLRPRRVLGSNSNCVLQTPAGPSEKILFEQTDPMLLTGGSLRKSEKAWRSSSTWEMEEEADIRPEYRSISWELRALAKMIGGDELGNQDCAAAAADTDTRNSLTSANSSYSTPLFERGRLYEEYSARRNERLNRKKKIKEANYSTNASASASKYNKYNSKLGVTVESTKRNTFTSTSTTTSSTRKLQSLRKSVSAAYSVVETPWATPTTSQFEKQAPTPTPRYMLRSLMNKENKKPPLPQPTLHLSHNHKSAIRGGQKIEAPSPTPIVGGY